MQKRGLLNRLRSYIWKEGDEPETRVQVGLDDTTKSTIKLSDDRSPAISRSFSMGPVDSPNEELRSFFEENGDRELSKVEVLGVLNLISQAVVRDESVLDLSTISQSANSSAYPPNLSNSFSTSNIGDLTSGSRRRSARRPLASGPKRSGSSRAIGSNGSFGGSIGGTGSRAKSIVRSQSTHGIGMRKAPAPVDVRKRMSIKPSTSMRDISRDIPREVSIEASREHMSNTATDVLDIIDNEPTPAPVTPGAGLRRRPGTMPDTWTKPAPAAAPAPITPAQPPRPPHSADFFSAPAVPAAPAFASTPAKPLSEPKAQSQEEPKTSVQNLFTQPKEPEAAPKPATQAPAAKSVPFTLDSAPTLPPLDVDVDMDIDIDFPEATIEAIDPEELQDGQKLAQTFVF